MHTFIKAFSRSEKELIKIPFERHPLSYSSKFDPNDFKEYTRFTETEGDRAMRVGDVVVLSKKFLKQNTSLIEVGVHHYTLVLIAEGLCWDTLYGMPLTDEIFSKPNLSLFKIESVNRAASYAAYKYTGKTNDQDIGKPLRYGDIIQLRHLHSGFLLRLNISHVSRQVGSWRPSIEDNSDTYSWIYLEPNARVKTEGQLVLYSDIVQLCFKSGDSFFYLNFSSKNKQVWEAMAQYDPTGWRVMLYQGYEVKGDALCYGVPFMIKSKAADMLLGCSVRKSPPTWLDTIRNDRFISGSLSASMIELEPVIKDNALELTYIGGEQIQTYWMLEGTDRLLGGEVEFDKPVYIKNLSQGKYLTQNLTLTDYPSETDMFILKSRNESEGSISFTSEVTLTNWYGQAISTSESEEEPQYSKMLDVMCLGIEANSVKGNLKLSKTKYIKTQQVFQIIEVKESESRFLQKVLECIPIITEFVDFVRGLESAPGRFDLARAFVIRREEDLAIYWSMQMGKAMKLIKGMLEDVSDNYYLLAERQNILEALNVHELLVGLSKIVIEKFFRTTDVKYSSQVKSGMKELIDQVFRMLNVMVSQNSKICHQLTTYYAILCDILVFNVSQIGSLLTQIYTLVEAEIEDIENYFAMWFERLATVHEGNIEEQTIILKLLDTIILLGNRPKAEYQAALGRLLFIEGENFPLLSFKAENGVPYVKFLLKSIEDVDTFTERNSKLRGIDFDLNTGYVPMDSFLELKHYNEYIRQAMQLLNTLATPSYPEGRAYIQKYLGLDLEYLTLIMSPSFRNINLKSIAVMIIINLEFDSVHNYSGILKNLSFDEEALYSREETGAISKEHLEDWTIQFWSRVPEKGMFNNEEKLRYIESGFYLSLALIDNGMTENSLNILTEALSVMMKTTVNEEKHWILEALMHEQKDFTNIEKGYKLSRLNKTIVKLLKFICTIHSRKSIKSILFDFYKIREYYNNSQRDTAVFTRIKTIIEAEGDDSDQSFEPEPFNIKASKLEVLDYLLSVMLSPVVMSSSVYSKILKVVHLIEDQDNHLSSSLNKVDIIVDSRLIVLKKRIESFAAELLKNMYWQNIIESSYDFKPNFDQLMRVYKVIEDLFETLNIRAADEYTLYKIQNLLRHNRLHLSIIKLWAIMSDSNKFSRRGYNKLGAKRCISLCSSFIFFFILKNPTNTGIVKKLLKPNKFSFNLPMLPFIIQHLSNDFSHMPTDLTQDFIKAAFSSCASVTEVKNLNPLRWLQALLFNADGEPNQRYQFFIAAECINACKGMALLISSNAQLYSRLLTTLVYCTSDNNSVVCQVRNIYPIRYLIKFLTEHHDKYPELGRAAMLLIDAIYFDLTYQALTSSELITVLQLGLKMLTQLKLKELADVASLGLYELVIPKHNPALVEYSQYDTSEYNKAAESWKFICDSCIQHGSTGFISVLMNVESLVKNRSRLETPELTDLLERCRSYLEDLLKRVESLSQDSMEYLDFTPLIIVLSKFTCLLEDVEIKEDSRGGQRNLDLQLSNFCKSFSSTLKADNKSAFYISLARGLKSVGKFKMLYDISCSEEDLNNIADILRLLCARLKETEHIGEFYKIVKEIIPDDEELLENANYVCWKSGILKYAFKFILENHTVEDNLMIISFLNKIASRQTQEFQEQIMRYLHTSKNAALLFFKIKENLRNYAEMLQKYSNDLNIERNYRFMIRKSSLYFKLDSFPEKERNIVAHLSYTSKLIKLTHLLCDNCYEDFQNYLREQVLDGLPLSRQTNLVREVSDFLVSVAGVQVVYNTPWIHILEATFQALIDFVSGPCEANQDLLGNNSQLIVTVKKIIIKTAMTDSEKIDSETLAGRALVFSLACQFLNTLLESHVQPTIAKTLVDFLDLTGMIQVVRHIYETLVQGREDQITLQVDKITDKLAVYKEQQIESATMLVIILIRLKAYNVPECKDFFDDGRNTSMIMLKAQKAIRYLNERVEQQRCCIDFFISHIGYVEILRDDKIEQHQFMIPYKFKYLTDNTKWEIIMELDRTSRATMIKDFFKRTKIAHKEVEHQQLLHTKPRLKWLTSQWKFFWLVAFILVLIVNSVMLDVIDDTDQLQVEESAPDALFYLLAPGILIVIFSTLGHAFYLAEFYPVILMRELTRTAQTEMTNYYKIPHNDSTLMGKLSDTFTKSKAGITYDTLTTKQKVLNLIFTFDTFYYILFIIVALVSLSKPIWYSFLLLDIIKRSDGLKNILKAITMSAYQLLLTLLLGVMFIYIFSAIALRKFSHYYQNDELDADDKDAQANTYCNSLNDCFFSTLNNGVRNGGGIGDAIRSPRLDDDDYNERFWFDMAFFIIVIIILLNIIFGIIIDNFAVLRDKRVEHLESINTKCIICETERSKLELRGAGWGAHFMSEHSPFAYMAFLIYINDKDIYDCSGLEKYVKECWQVGSSAFLPNEEVMDRKLNG